MNLNKWVLLCLLLGIGTISACQRKSKIEAPQASVAMEYVHLKVSKADQPFEVAEVHTEIVNGRFNMAVRSSAGSMVQFNGLPQVQLSQGVKSGELFQLIFMPAGMKPACMSVKPELNRAEFIRTSDGKWMMKLQGEVKCNKEKHQIDLQLFFTEPEPVFVAPNN